MRYRIDIHERINYAFAILMLLVLAPALMNGQPSRNDLETKRKQLLQEIRQTQNLLQQTQKNKAATLDRYFALQSQIKKRQELINTLVEEIGYADASINRAYEVIDALEVDVERLKEEYTRMLRMAYRLKMNRSLLLFLFSADSFNDAFQRWQYIRQYDKYRKKQAQLILDTQQTLESRARQLEKEKEEKENLLGSQRQQKQLMNQELKDKDVLLQSLKKDESRLIAELDEQQKAHQQLNSAIEKVIREEMARKRREARSADALNNPSPLPSETAGLSGDFQRNKGRLPWPVRNGFITRYFGTQPHPTIKGVEITNNGIDIRTVEKAEVMAVFDGTVVGTQFIPGYKNTVIVQHGTYYTVYSNLEELFFDRGDKVKAKDAIGTVSQDKPEVHFEVWKEKQRLNPVNWVAKRS